MLRNVILCGDVRQKLRELEDESVNCCVTSPPYWGLRDYGTDGQLGLESTPEAFVCNMVEVFRDVRRVLRKDGTLWLNLGDSYNSGGNPPGEDKAKWSPLQGGRSTQIASRRAWTYTLKPKDLVGIPWRVAFALQADGWYLRSDIIWSKPNPMPESVTDRPTKAHEYLFLLSKSERYYYDADTIREPMSPVSIARISQPNFQNQHGGAKDYGPDSNRSARRSLQNLHDKLIAARDWEERDHAATNPLGRNRRTVWEIATEPYPEAHFATYPTELVKPCILAGCPEGGVVLDPFFGSGTTGFVAARAGRDYIGIELNPAYVEMAERRLAPVKARLL